MSKQTDWFLDINRADSPTKMPPKSLVVSKVASGSPAEELGLVPGDFFVSVNGTPALGADLLDILISNEEATYVFISVPDQVQITVRTPSLPLGIRTVSLPDDIVQSYKSRPLHDFDDIQALWEREDYARIREICKNATAKGVMGKIGLSKSKDPIADVLIAICDVEEGKGKTPYNTIVAFEKAHGDRIRSDLAGVVSYYVARQHLEGGDQRKYGQVMRWVMESPYNQESPRLRANADANNVFYRSESMHVGKQFDRWSEGEFLEGGDGKGFVPNILKQTQPGQVTPFCLMLTYRGNAPYNDALKVYHAIYPFVKDRVQPMIVLTTIRDKPKEHPEYFAAEEALIAGGVPITVMFDRDSFWHDRVIAGAPENIVVNNKAQIVWHDDLNDDYAYWEMLSQVQAA